MDLSKRQTEIIDVSIKIIDKKGIQGLTIKNISKEIGISEAAIYRHFKSKKEILLTILSNFDELSSMFSDIMKTYEDTAKEKIQFMFGKMIDVFIESPTLVAVFFSEDIFKNETALKEVVKQIQVRNLDTLRDIITKGKENKDVREDVDTSSLTYIIMGALRLLVKKWGLNDQDFCLRIEGKKLINSINQLIAK